MADSTTARSLQRAEEYIANYQACRKLYQSGKLEECADAVRHYLKTIDNNSSLSFLILLAGCSVDEETANALHQANTLWSSSRAFYAHGQTEEVETALNITRLLLDTTKRLHEATDTAHVLTKSDHVETKQDASEKKLMSLGTHNALQRDLR
ncbi:unnamed protein product [Zymoseptoria tritici ST99CH_1A5]|uniref:Uncharacterized protein n=1 Tax=Zymoseptoria tritici ST99CH_1A5 TaxID=1276529 RepID=A0A1Y6LAD2_ZYMTR|nr:unnamed protein product [Zymoseptoria tritici ST99CH_1A5]